MYDTMSFKHLVGKSTLKEGITIHKNFQDLFDSPQRGGKREITLILDVHQTIAVTLKRLNNLKGNVQIRYNKKSHKILLDWLNETFRATREGNLGEFLEFQKVAPDQYTLKPITIEMANDAHLFVAETIYHKINQEEAKNYPAICEIQEIIASINFKVNEGQNFYNKRIEDEFLSLGWDNQGKAIPPLDLKYDFRKNGVQVEVEFGNARAYYQDYIKFILSYKAKNIEVGTLITPTVCFANLLCEIGRLKAIARGRKTYSGMINFEKVDKEFNYLKFLLDMPIIIIGIDIIHKENKKRI